MDYVKNHLKLFISILIMSVLVLFTTFITPTSIFAVSNNINSFCVLDDLYRDKTFNKDNYPNVDNDYAVYVMQIGESDKDELFIYVYQPSNNSIDLIASSVSISYGFSQNGLDLKPQSYDLELISTNGVFDKYYVKGFVIPKHGERFYNIVSISRKFNSVIDKNIDMGTTNEISYSVGQQWCCYDINNTVKYEMVTFETLDVDIVLAETFYLPSGIKWGNLVGTIDNCDAWTIFFNVNDYIVEKIYDATLTYDICKVTESWAPIVGTSVEKGKSERVNLKLTEHDQCNVQSDGLLGKKYNWNRIQSSTNFLNTLKENNIGVSTESMDVINKSQWCFSFLETERIFNDFANSYQKRYSEVTNVGILRLHFLDQSGLQYDLGVVSDKVTADNIYGGHGNLIDIKNMLADFGVFFQKFMMIFSVILIFVVLCFASSILTPIFTLGKVIIKFIISIISLPFKLIRSFFK